MILFGIKEARELVSDYNSKESYLFHKIICDNLSINSDEDNENIKEALEEKIKGYKWDGYSKWVLTPVEIRDFFFKLSINNLSAMINLIEKNKLVDSDYDMIYDLAILVYRQKSEMIMHKNIESMSYDELYHYICNVTNPKSSYGCSSLDEYLFGEFISDNKDELTTYVYNKFHNKEVEAIVKKYKKVY